MCISVQLLKHIYQGVSQSLRSNEGVLVIGAPAGGYGQLFRAFEADDTSICIRCG
jgi:hypothetical protein